MSTDEKLRTREELIMLQSLPLEVKILKTQQRIREWVQHFGVDGVYISFSGGKDSTVLLHLVRELYPEVEAVFVNTGLEYPEIQRFVKTFDNVTVLYPKKTFKQVIYDYGYPILSKEIAYTIQHAKKGSKRCISKMNGEVTYNGKKSRFCLDKYKPLLKSDFNISNNCCDIMKKNPAKLFEKQTGKTAIIATLASESLVRQNRWILFGCNSFGSDRPTSKPMSFWTEQDVLQYIKDKNIKIPSVYGKIIQEIPGQFEGQLTLENIIEYFDNSCKLCTTGCDRTGCIFCGFGAHLEKGETRFQRLKRTHPKQYDFCINGGGYDVDGLWKPNKDGLGMGHVFDTLNDLYGKDFIRYK